MPTVSTLTKTQGYHYNSWEEKKNMKPCNNVNTKNGVGRQQ